MARSTGISFLLLTLAVSTVRAESPQMLFTRSQIPELRERITQPEFAPIWAGILKNAEAYCDPQSPQYANPADPYPLPVKGEYISQSRHDALLAHRVGGTLTKRMEAIGVAYQLTGRQELGRHGARLLLATVEKYPITNPLISKGFAGGRGDVMRGLAMGYDLLSDQLDDEQRRVVASACADYLDFFVAEFNNPKVWWYKVHNYNGVIAEYENDDRCGYALADCTEAYNRNNKEMLGAVVERAKRHAFFVYPLDDAPAYAVVMDDIRKDDQPHRFTWQMMYSKQMAVTLDDGRAAFKPIETSGEGYVDTPFDSSQGGGYCVLDCEIAEAGEYVLWARVRTQDGTPGQADSFFVGMDNDRRIDWHMPRSETWTWGKVSAGVQHEPLNFKLATGKHKLTLQMREPGAQMDCVLLARDRGAVPEFPDAWEEALFVEAEAGRLSGAMRLVPTENAKPRLVVHIGAESKPVLSTDVFKPEDYHGPAEFPRFRATVQAVEPRFLAVLLPLPGGTEEPEVKFESVAEKRLVRIKWPGHVDVFEWSASDGTARLLELP